MIDPNTREALEADTTAFRRLRNPAAAPSTTGPTTKAFRMPIVVKSLTIDAVPTDMNSKPLPYVVLLDMFRQIDVATWSDVSTGKTQNLPADTDISQCWLIATHSKADWDAVRQSILDGSGNGEPGTATNGTGHS